MASFGDTSLRNIGQYVAKNGSLLNAASAIGRAMNRYRAKYIQCKGARMTPFWHVVGVCMAINYYIEYPHLKSMFASLHLFIVANDIRFKICVLDNSSILTILKLFYLFSLSSQ